MGTDVLVADDNADIRTVAEAKLQTEFNVETVTDGRAAWEYLTGHAEDPPEIIVLDVMMPELDGFSVLERVRAHETLTDVPVLVLTSRSREEDVVQALETGADDFVAKPFSADELIVRVRKILEEP